MDFQRSVNILEILKKKSVFLFGPRSTGKTSLIKRQCGQEVFVIDLLLSRYALALQENPSLLSEMIASQKCNMIVIDEIQKIPALLDEVHHLIETKKIHFLLTGSSARKLKRQEANMLGGRATQASLFPLTWFEMSQSGAFDLSRTLRFGTLPRVYLAEDPESELFDYVDIYLKEEIMAEAAVRNLPALSRFLKLAALSSSEQINYSNIASDVGLSAKTVRAYFEILDDTLLGHELPSWRQGKKRKSVASSKHYLFDPGIIHTLAGTRVLDRNSELYGRAFEHFVLREVQAYNSYCRKRWDLSFWRTLEGDEVDLIVDDRIAIEVKATTKVTARDLKGLLKIREEANTWQRLILVSHDPIERLHDNILLMPWEIFLKKLWHHEF